MYRHKHGGSLCRALVVMNACAILMRSGRRTHSAGGDVVYSSEDEEKMNTAVRFCLYAAAQMHNILHMSLWLVWVVGLRGLHSFAFPNLTVWSLDHWAVRASATVCTQNILLQLVLREQRSINGYGVWPLSLSRVIKQECNFCFSVVVGLMIIEIIPQAPWCSGCVVLCSCDTVYVLWCFLMCVFV